MSRVCVRVHELWCYGAIPVCVNLPFLRPFAHQNTIAHSYFAVQLNYPEYVFGPIDGRDDGNGGLRTPRRALPLCKGCRTSFRARFLAPYVIITVSRHTVG
ncbi:uncharacterized protein LOC112691680 [Sipha flava]|uniref:Uncharacterized protein LOC112691680 n=1 Tax=Sipha flava TaxID=143950 RepID=A0A8B8GGV4_9HEMI|nr:uncharacterized protein LOC112691680 [Sipha flava]